MEITNNCVRCGKQRVLVKTWDELTVSTTITRSIWYCPDPECQKIVDKGIQDKKDKAEALRRDIEEKAQARKAENQKPQPQVK